MDLNAWETDPENFVMTEDESFLVEFDLQEDNSINLLAQHLIEKIIQKFYHIVYPFVQGILEQYLGGKIVPQDVKIEDALLNLAGIVGKVQRENKVKQEKLMDINFVFNYLKDSKWESPIFKRRFLLILSHWVRIMPKTIFFDWFQFLCLSLKDTGSNVE